MLTAFAGPTPAPYVAIGQSVSWKLGSVVSDDKNHNLESVYCENKKFVTLLVSGDLEMLNLVTIFGCTVQAECRCAL
jgi:hypothetical protein